jgi:hypothetical protein
MAGFGAEEAFSAPAPTSETVRKAAILHRGVGSTLLRRYTLGERKQANIGVV